MEHPQSFFVGVILQIKHTLALLLKSILLCHERKFNITSHYILNGNLIISTFMNIYFVNTLSFENIVP